MTECDAIVADAEEFVLADIDGVRRAEIVAHLAHCPSCQAEVTSLATTVDALSATLVAPVEPTAGFVDRVIAGTPRVPAPRRRRRPARAAIGVAAAAAAIVVAAGAAALAGHPGSNHARQPVAVADLRTSDGGGVGQAVVIGTRSARISVGFDVADHSDPTSYDGRYTILAVLRDGHRVPLGQVVVNDGRGGLETDTSLAAVDITTIKVQSPSGRDLCAGLVPPSPGPTPNPTP